MPIRINLLAEAQAVEEERRKDPVKRAVLAAVCLVSLMLLWSSSLQVKVMAARSRLGDLEAKWRTIEKNYAVAVDHQRQTIEAEEKLTALHQLTTNRFLWGSALNAFQQTLDGVEEVQTVRLKTEQSYKNADDNKGKPGGPPPQAIEKISLTIEAMDSSRQPGRDQVARFKDAINRVPYFQAALRKTNGVRLTSLSAPQVSSGHTPFVMFTLQCDLPEKVR